jgi:RNA polymerase sigma-70 factor (ECF subfamily)
MSLGTPDLPLSTARQALAISVISGMCRSGISVAGSGTSNEELLKRVARGDRDAFRALYAATAPRLLGICIRILRDSARAEEAVQDAFVRVWERAGSFDETKGAALAWMTVLTRRVALNESRRRDKVHSSLDESDAPEIAADLPEPDPLGKRRLLDCLEKLDAECRQWVLLAYVYGYSHDELAERFDRPRGTMKSALFRSLADLRKCVA